MTFLDPDTADAIVALRGDGTGTELKHGWPVDVLTFDGAGDAMMECCFQIKKAWEQTVPDEKQHLGHAAVGMWLFYWPAKDLKMTWELVRQGRVDDIRESASKFIASGFGAVPSLA